MTDEGGVPRQCRSRFRHSALHFSGLTMSRVNRLSKRRGRGIRLRGIVKEFRANDRTANQQQYNARPETAAERGMLLVVEIEGFEPSPPCLQSRCSPS